MSQTDFKPSRLTVTMNVLEAFIKDYFDQNPLSQLGIIITKKSIAEKITELSSNPTKHITALKAHTVTEGEVSLQNALDVARTSLCYVPKYGSREIVLLFESLTTCDPGDIFATIDQVKADNIQCSVVGAGAHVHVCKAIAERTGGSYHVALNEAHLRELVFAHSPPPPSTQKVETSLIRMGFPQRNNNLSLCVCHQAPKSAGYFCPQCGNKFCELPIDCQICGLTLISSPHLARSYHHLFPVNIFTETPVSDVRINCFACQKNLPAKSAIFTCSNCSRKFCNDCDDYIHESLHNCPGCEMTTQHIK
jgi:transcription initiation factor TFIIH subunit 2